MMFLAINYLFVPKQTKYLESNLTTYITLCKEIFVLRRLIKSKNGQEHRAL